MIPTAVALLQTFVAISVFYVWVVRYPAVVAEFKDFGLPDWLRDLVGAAKLTAAYLLLELGPIEGLVPIGALGIVLLMAAALMMHLKAKNPLIKMAPSLGLGIGALLVLLYQIGA